MWIQPWEITPFWWGVFIIGGLFCVVSGIVGGLSYAWKAREKRDGLR